MEEGGESWLMRSKRGEDDGGVSAAGVNVVVVAERRLTVGVNLVKGKLI